MTLQPFLTIPSVLSENNFYFPFKAVHKLDEIRLGFYEEPTISTTKSDCFDIVGTNGLWSTVGNFTGEFKRIVSNTVAHTPNPSHMFL